MEWRLPLTWGSRSQLKNLKPVWRRRKAEKASGRKWPRNKTKQELRRYRREGMIDSRERKHAEVGSYKRRRWLELRGEEGKCERAGYWGGLETDRRSYMALTLKKSCENGHWESQHWPISKELGRVTDIPDFILTTAPVMSVGKVLEVILRGLGHFAAIKCPYKWQLIGSNVWFPIFLSICVSPVIRVPKCSVHQSAQSDFSIETEEETLCRLQSGKD